MLLERANEGHNKGCAREFIKEFNLFYYAVILALSNAS